MATFRFVPSAGKPTVIKAEAISTLHIAQADTNAIDNGLSILPRAVYGL